MQLPTGDGYANLRHRDDSRSCDHDCWHTNLVNRAGHPANLGCMPA